MVGFVSLFQCEIKLIHQTVNFVELFLFIFTGGANNSGGNCIYKNYCMEIFLPEVFIK